MAERYIKEAARAGEIRIIAHRPDGLAGYRAKEKETRRLHNIVEDRVIFLEVCVTDASDFSPELLLIEGVREKDYEILRCKSPAVPTAIAALMLRIRNKTGKIPHVYFGWTEGNPLIYVLKYLFLGEGETAPVTREVLRAAEPDPDERPRVHVA
jgi:hypothetical protein